MSSGPVAGFPGGTAVPRDDIIGFDCELLLPAAQPDVVTTDNAAKISARVIIEGASIPVPSRPMTPRAAADQMAGERLRQALALRRRF
jgi:glutamate dehydrogenase/leucine dehydrogenase